MIRSHVPTTSSSKSLTMPKLPQKKTSPQNEVWLDLSGMHPYTNDTHCLVRCPIQQDFDELRAAQRGMFRKRGEKRLLAPPLQQGLPFTLTLWGLPLYAGKRRLADRWHAAPCTIAQDSGLAVPCHHAAGKRSWTTQIIQHHLSFVGREHSPLISYHCCLHCRCPWGLHWNQVPTVPGAASPWGSAAEPD